MKSKRGLRNALRKNEIIALFEHAESKEDFLKLLNLGKAQVYKKPYPIKLKQLNFYISKNSRKLTGKYAYYYAFEIKKKSGKTRTIHAPCKGLKQLQEALLAILECLYKPHSSATGFVAGKSIVDNAQLHLNKTYVYNIDLKDFFHSVDADRIWARLLYPPFNLGSSDARKKLANMIKTLCTHTFMVERLVDGEWTLVERAVLPQGAITSPFLTNVIAEKLDIKLNGLAKRFGLTYSRYADDITFSSNHNTFPLESGEVENIYSQGSLFDTELRRIISSQNFHINEAKVRLQKKGYRQEVTGLTVNAKPNVARRYVKTLRHWLYLWERYGTRKAEYLISKNYADDKGLLEDSYSDFKFINIRLVIEGKLLFLKMVKGDEDPTYQKLRERFLKLKSNPYSKGFEKEKTKQALYSLSSSAPVVSENQVDYSPREETVSTENYLQDIIELILNDGLDQAMQHYKRHE